MNFTVRDAHLAGRLAARRGGSVLDNPFRAAQGSPDRPLAFAWRRGFMAARSEAEIDEQERGGHFKEGTQ